MLTRLCCSYCVQAMCQNVIRDPAFAKDPITALKQGFLRTDQEVLPLVSLALLPSSCGG